METLDALECPGFITFHEGGISDNIGSKDGGEFAIH
jgi:hypothetical protein